MKRLVLSTLLAGFLSASAHAAWLGGEFDSQPKDRTPGVVVRNVVDDSPAARAGLRSGDVIVAVQLRPVSKATDLACLVRTAAGGTRLSLALLRDGAPVEAIVVLGNAPSESARTSTSVTLHAAAAGGGSALPRHVTWSGVFVEIDAGATPAEPRSQSVSQR